MRFIVMCCIALGLGVAVADARKDDPVTARAELKNSKGQPVGKAELTEATGGVLVRLMLSKASVGVHAFHMHATGKCDAPSFESAGAHLNPAKAQHGLQNPQGPHQGDLPNLHIGQSGMLDAEVMLPGASLMPGANSLFDADGSALVLHAAADDYKTDPAGNAGDRVACGVVMR